MKIWFDSAVKPPLYLFDRDGWFYSLADLRTVAGWIEPLTIEAASIWFDAEARPVGVTTDSAGVARFELIDARPVEEVLRVRLVAFVSRKRSQVDTDRLTTAELVSLAQTLE